MFEVVEVLICKYPLIFKIRPLTNAGPSVPVVGNCQIEGTTESGEARGVFFMQKDPFKGDERQVAADIEQVGGIRDAYIATLKPSQEGLNRAILPSRQLQASLLQTKCLDVRLNSGLNFERKISEFVARKYPNTLLCKKGFVKPNCMFEANLNLLVDDANDFMHKDSDEVGFSVVIGQRIGGGEKGMGLVVKGQDGNIYEMTNGVAIFPFDAQHASQLCKSSQQEVLSFFKKGNFAEMGCRKFENIRYNLYHKSIDEARQTKVTLFTQEELNHFLNDFFIDIIESGVE